ncbi:DEHA2B11836p [Debaryomyces hansenii CBS767]|uniref:DEHA2B11836p n=1 Tax=Debaryomyces hansenii (strain ATCC 36239 / CBS 767 / BCRC 21394 / JCM 1990 / NBRC 0083 / IGC 2968) TaxID=284592 RepID=Q6BWF1_DEBHA|nr:DEHA2B11836p [Debaryomyces hansenii CBS767]CAG85472.2 DEHA2B11836p [Debaryomyces hansenii CBS767]|eukprot:XP_457468.2 DEHA2B11836p [Debaryomyces hansenii CBS767]
MHVLDLPYNVLDDIIGYLNQSDLVSLGRTNRVFHSKVNQMLYKRIMILDSEGHNDQYSLLDVRNVGPFARELTKENFQLIEKVVIHTQSNLIEYNYKELYDSFIRQWEKVKHPIYFVNLDINNLRKYQSFNNYISQESIQYSENEDEQSFEVDVQDTILNNLTNWIAFDINELISLPYNPSLRHLNLFIEQSFLLDPIERLNRNVLRNMENLKALYLNSPKSTSVFIKTFSGKVKLNLRKLSLSSSHTFKADSLLTFREVSQLVNFQDLEELELKINCTNHYCPNECMVQFFRDWFSSCRDPLALAKLVLINFKSNPHTDNLLQFNKLIENELFCSMISNLREIYLNINDLTKLTLDNKSSLNYNKFFKNLSRLPNLAKIVIPDFFNDWVVNLPRLFNKRTNFFDLLVNQCDCKVCNDTRLTFNKLSTLDSKNHFQHDFDNFTNSSADSSSIQIDTTSESNLKFLNYIVRKLKQQFIYLNQNLYSINSILNSNDRPLLINRDLDQFKNLFLHSCLLNLIKLFKIHIPSLRSINLGGIQYLVPN